jgi:hypothetical protein
VVNPILMSLWQLWEVAWARLGFTEFRYARHEMEGFLAAHQLSTSPRYARTTSYLPWSKGLFCDLCDSVASFRTSRSRPYEFRPLAAASPTSSAARHLALVRRYLLHRPREKISPPTPTPGGAGTAMAT